MSPASLTMRRRMIWTSIRPILQPARFPGPLFSRTRQLIEDRDEIEHFYRSRTNSGKFDAESYLAFNKSCETLLHTLKANISVFSANDYQQAQSHFVEDLRTSAKSAGN